MNKLIKNKRSKIALAIIASIVGLYLLTLFIPGVHPYTRYPLFLLKCGKQPLIAYRIVGRTYNTPEGKNYKINPYIAEYFCTEQEAQRAGYTKSSLDNF